MSSVPAARIDRLARPNRPTLRLIHSDALELYPTLFQAIRAAWRRDLVTSPTRTEAELGRQTGARV